MIKLPVIRSVDISDYQVYQNDSSSGISHLFEGGVHLIIGVNGLGKTTLLNALYRVLVGPKDVPKSDIAPLGSSGHSLTNWRNSTFFRSRVKDGALHAIIKCKVTFGQDNLEISRKLSNLEIISLKLNDENLPASQDEYEKTVVEISGTADYVDFYSIVKYLLFFLEDRTELIWDERAQFEMLRILFFDLESSKEAVMFYDRAQKADSKYRNIHASLKTIKDRIKEYSNTEVEGAKAKFLIEKAKLLGLEDKLIATQETQQQQLNNIEDAKLLRATISRELDEIKYAIDFKQHLIYEHFLPAADSAIEYIFRNLSSGNGCLACGNKNATEDYFEKKFKLEHHCPICDTKLAHENTKLLDLDVLNTELQTLYFKIDKLEKSYLSQDTLLDVLNKDIYNTERLLSETLSEIKISQKQVRKIQFELPPDETEIQELQRIVSFREIELRQEDNIRIDSHNNYVKILERNNVVLQNKMKLLEKRFSYYSKNLLAEKVFIRCEKQLRKIGQGIPSIPFPSFKVLMTSGVFDKEPSRRDDASSVSESQKEFIDLAFRLSLIDVVTHDSDSPAMIVMETPEASLDSLFMHNAGRLFREFANDQKQKNLFLASTNLNKSEMIPTLLGSISSPTIYDKTDVDLLLDQDGEELEDTDVGRISVDERSNHIINLLELSAPNLSLKTHREEYRSMYYDSVYPERSDN
ncbi:TPA: AAA family ATPase [Yersinia enterocolitica]|nr:AAA family ATPase [Yersinia enterocolitica]